MRYYRGIILSIAIFGLLGFSGCSSATEDTSEAREMTETAVVVAALGTEIAEAIAQDILPELSPSPTTLLPTETMEPTIAPTAKAQSAVIRVSVNTNCRSGPDRSYDFLGVLSVGEVAEIRAKSSVDSYWYIVNPDDPEGFCWLWDEYATIEGDANGLPLITPEPTPTPYVGFDVWFHGFEPCAGSQTAIFAIQNGGAVRLWSGWVGVFSTDPLDSLYGPTKERHPFADRPLPACPPGHGNELYPGEVRYIHTPLNALPNDSNAYAEITLCSADHGGGDCVTKIGYFYIP